MAKLSSINKNARRKKLVKKFAGRYAKLKAMAKDPAERYQSANEMMAALFGDPAVQDSVMSLSPQTLSIEHARAKSA